MFQVRHLIWIDARVQKPPVFTLVLVHGGVALWNGVDWVSRMEEGNRPIQWEVLWWAYMPMPPNAEVQ